MRGKGEGDTWQRDGYIQGVQVKCNFALLLGTGPYFSSFFVFAHKLTAVLTYIFNNLDLEQFEAYDNLELDKRLQFGHQMFLSSVDLIIKLVLEFLSNL